MHLVDIVSATLKMVTRSQSRLFYSTIVMFWLCRSRLHKSNKLYMYGEEASITAREKKSTHAMHSETAEQIEKGEMENKC